MIIKKSKGCLFGFINYIDKEYLELVPIKHKDNQKSRDDNKYHITIIEPNEVSKEQLNNYNIIEKEVKILNLGLSKIVNNNNEVFYLFIYSDDLNKIRKEFDLPPKNFHITLGFKFNDIHDKEKGYDNIFLKNKDINDDIIQEIEYISKDVKNYLKNNYYLPKLLIKELKKNFNKNKLNYNTLIENDNYLGYIFKYQETGNIDDLIEAIKKYNYDINKMYDSNNNGTLNCIKKVNQHIMKDMYAYRRKMYYYCEVDKKIECHEMPRNFSWVIENKIGGISKIRSEKDILVLQTLDIGKIYYFLEKNYFDDINKHNIKINYVHCLNTMAPKLEDMLNTLQNEDFDKPILFGCLGGFGRTGTALACYLCYFGLNNKPLNSEQAITYLRNVRPKSIESNVQMDFIKQFSNNLYKIEDKDNINKKIKTSIKFIMLVGLPGSGKSTFSQLFMTNGMNIKIINQDVMGRKISESSLLKFIKESDITILDRVNYTREDRISWLKNTTLQPKQCLCIYLSTPKFVCIDRVKNRTNHPTIKKGGGERIIKDIDSKFEIPIKEEGFSDVIVLEDEEDVRNYLKTWKCQEIELIDDNSTFIHKFPRTKHIFNIGGATIDDRLLESEEYNSFMDDNDVFIAEKVDGAQMGISIDENYKIIVQNRSHYVNSKSHKQFEKLDKWIHDHKDSLYEILDNDTILFGEWL